MKRIPPWPVLGVLVLVGLGVAAVFLLSGRSDRGFEILPGCAGVVIHDEPTALAWARQRGREAPSDWGAHLRAELGGPGCDVLIPLGGLAGQRGFLFRLVRAYVAAAIAAGRVPLAEGQDLLVNLREEAIAAGVPLFELPEGL